MEDDLVNLARIYSETVNRLNVFSRRVQEGRDVEAASEFARWLSWSGIITLFKRYPNVVPSFDPLKVDGAFLEWKCNELISACNERFVSNSLAPSIGKEEFESIHEKIDRMAGYLSRLTAARVINVETVSGQHSQPSAPINESVIHIPLGDEQAAPGLLAQPTTFQVATGGLQE